MKKAALSFFLLFCAPRVSAQVYDTISIHFGMNEQKLSAAACNFIDSLIFHDVLIHGQLFTVLGYTDYVGDNEYNNALSKERAQNVKNYLIKMGFEPGDITLCMGKGKIERLRAIGKDGIAEDRKVEIIIDGNPREKVIETPVPEAAVAPAAQKVAAKPVKQQVDVAALQVNEAMALQNLFFVGGTHQLLPGSAKTLETLFRQLNANPKVKIQIEGHICCLMPDEGSDVLDIDHSGMLSQTRAKAVFDYLVGKGIDATRMKYIGLGYTKPIFFPEKNDEEREQNRRVEIRVVSK